MKNKVAMMALLLCNIGNPLFAKSYSCGAVLPNEVYCPANMICAFAAPTCIMNIGAIGMSAITQELYNLNIPENAFKKVVLAANQYTKLPFNAYPALGEHLAYQIAAAKGKFANVPFRIVIRTEVPTEKFINKIERGIKQLTDAKEIEGAKDLVASLKNLKSTKQGINAVYRIVPALGEQQYKLYYVRVPSEQPGYIIGRPDGDLEFHERDPKDAKKELVTVIDTGVLM